jgi:N-acyl-L-homoserine lactone synthetase
MRVHVVTTQNRCLYLEEIEAMHRHRHEVFVGQLGWKDLESPDGLDIDEFDTEHATYLLAIDDAGALMGSGRLIPSWRPHMLKNLFPEYCANGQVPVGPGIWEWTRHAPPGRRFARDVNARVNMALNTAVLEFAASRGIDFYTGILEARMVNFAAEIGWRSEPLGPPLDYKEGTAIGLLNHLWPGQLEFIRKKAGITEPLLFEAPVRASPELGRMTRQSLQLAMRVPANLLPVAVRSLEALADLPAQGA